MKTILVPTDFSSPAKNAAYYAAHLAGEFQSKLILLNVYSLPAGGVDNLSSIDMLSDLERYSKKGLDELKEILSSVKGIGEIICISRMGIARTVISIVAREHSVDGIVMGITGGASKIKEKVIGSTTLDIAREGNEPLFIVPEGIEYHKIQKMSFACDIDNLQGSRVLENIKDFSISFNSKLEVVNIEKPSPEEDPLRIRNYNFMESNLEEVKHETVVLTRENSQETLLDYFENHQTDLLILNPKKHNFIQSLFHKSMTKRMIFHLKVPMLILR